MTAIKAVGGKTPKWLLERLPYPKSIWDVYAVIVFLVYSWSMITSFYKLPSWLFYLTMGQIFSIYAYAFSIDLVESLLILAGVLLLEFSIFLPFRARDEFITRSASTVLIVLSSAMTRLILYNGDELAPGFSGGEFSWWLWTLLIGLLVAIVIPRSKILRRAVESFARQLTVFVYIYIPISMISILAVLLRNLD